MKEASLEPGHCVCKEKQVENPPCQSVPTHTARGSERSPGLSSEAPGETGPVQPVPMPAWDRLLSCWLPHITANPGWPQVGHLLLASSGTDQYNYLGGHAGHRPAEP